MYANGVQEKESVADRTARFFADLRRAYDEAVREKMSGGLELSINMNDGVPINRIIVIRDIAR